MAPTDHRGEPSKAARETSAELPTRRDAGEEVDAAVHVEGGSQPDSTLFRQLASRQGAFGRYRVKGEMARGGMGAILRVWDADLRRHLAMKVLLGKGEGKETGETPELEPKTLGRFLEEAQVTGQLDHPGIVPVHELGLDTGGRVYFTMRLVKGRDLARIFQLVREGQEDWTRVRALGVLLKVCEALAYAHSRKVIHRDLKPANLMVGRYGEVYVMDWGLAKVMGEEDRKDIRIRPQPESVTIIRSSRHEAADPDSPLYTMDGDVVGTPAYMSPEQARGDLAAMGPSSDVYSLGAILYHLLSGQPPFMPRGAKRNNYAVWAMVTAGPPAPIEELAPEEPPELLAICQRAMAREQGDRYADVRELAEDLRAFLEHRTVRAYRTGALVELRKWVERNRATAAASAAALLLALGGLGSTSWVQAGAKQREALSARKLAALNVDLEGRNEELARARDEAQAREREAIAARKETELASAQAERDAEKARGEKMAADRVVEFLVDLFEAPDPYRAMGEDVSAEEILDRGARRIGAELREDPLVRARLMATMGRAYRSLGLYAAAEPLLRESFATRRARLGEEDPNTLESWNDMAVLAHAQGRSDEAEALFLECLERKRRVLGEEHPETVLTEGNLAGLYGDLGRYEEAEALLTSVVEVNRRVLGDDDPATLGSINSLAMLYTQVARFEEAEPLFLECLEGLRRVVGEDHPKTLSALNNLALLVHGQGRYAEAERMLAQLLEATGRVFGEEHPKSLRTLNNLAVLNWNLGRNGKAIELQRSALEIRRRTLGEDHPDTLSSVNNLGVFLQQSGRAEEAEPLLLACLETLERIRGPNHPDTLKSRQNLADLYQTLGRYEEAEELFLSILEAMKEALGPEHRETLNVVNNLAALYLTTGRHGEAEPLFDSCLEGLGRVLGETHPDTLQTYHSRTVLHARQGRLEEAEREARWLLEVTPSDSPELPFRKQLLRQVLDLKAKGD